MVAVNDYQILSMAKDIIIGAPGIYGGNLVYWIQAKLETNLSPGRLKKAFRQLEEEGYVELNSCWYKKGTKEYEKAKEGV